MAKAARRADSVISLKVTLRDVRPPIWRRLLVPAGTTLDDLHHAIQAAMGWEDAHLHAFDIAGREYGDPREVDGAADEARLTVGGVLRSGVSRFGYPQLFIRVNDAAGAGRPRTSGAVAPAARSSGLAGCEGIGSVGARRPVPQGGLAARAARSVRLSR